jgi:hypothetical protein
MLMPLGRVRRTRKRFDLLFDPGQEFGHRDAQTSRYREYGLNREVVLAAFDTAHIGPVEAAMIGERFLRKASLSPKLADSASEYHL